MIKKIISGGQTGVDQGALDAAIICNVPHGGWIPKGRLTENGVLPTKYNLIEMPNRSYPKRTEKNIIESDGTILITNGGRLSGGSALTARLSKKLKSPFLHVDLSKESLEASFDKVLRWAKAYNIITLNIAGPRESKAAGIHALTRNFIMELLIRATKK